MELLSKKKQNKIIIQIYSNINSIQYGDISYLVRQLQKKKPHLIIQSYQWLEQSELDSHYWILLKAFDSNLKIYKTLKIQSMEFKKFEYREYLRELNQLHPMLINEMNNDIILKIYDIFILTTKQQGQVAPLYFCIEQECVYSTLQRCMDNQTIKIEEYKEILEESMFYLQQKLNLAKWSAKTLRKNQYQYYIISKSDNNYCLKLSPLNEKILSELNQIFSNQRSIENIIKDYDIHDRKEENEIISFSNLYNSNDDNSVDEDNSSSSESESESDIEEDKNLICSQKDIYQDTQQKVDGEQEIESNMSEIIDSKGDGHFSEMNERKVDKMETQKFNLQKQNQVIIHKEDFVSDLLELYPKLMERHDSQIFEVISQHPRYKDLILYDYDESTFIFKLKYEEKKHYLKCEKYQSIFEAEQIYKKCLLLKDSELFKPIIGLEIIPLQDSAYLLYLEEDQTNFLYFIPDIEYLQQQVNIVCWMLKVLDQYQFDQPSLSNILQSRLELIKSETGDNEVRFQFPNPYFRHERYLKSKSSYQFAYQYQELFSSLYWYFQVEEQFQSGEKQFKNYLKEKTVRLDTKISDYSYLDKVQNLLSQIVQMEKIWKKIIVRITSQLRLSWDFQRSYKELTNDILQRIFDIGECELNLTWNELDFILGLLSSPSNIKWLVIRVKYDQRLEEEDIHEQLLYMGKFIDYLPHLRSLFLQVKCENINTISNIEFGKLTELQTIKVFFYGNYMGNSYKEIENKLSCLSTLLDVFKNNNLQEIQFYPCCNLFYFIEFNVLDYMRNMNRECKQKQKACEFKKILQFLGYGNQIDDEENKIQEEKQISVFQGYPFYNALLELEEIEKAQERTVEEEEEPRKNNQSSYQNNIDNVFYDNNIFCDYYENNSQSSEQSEVQNQTKIRCERYRDKIEEVQSRDQYQHNKHTFEEDEEEVALEIVDEDDQTQKENVEDKYEREDQNEYESDQDDENRSIQEDEHGSEDRNEYESDEKDEHGSEPVDRSQEEDDEEEISEQEIDLEMSEEDLDLDMSEDEQYDNYICLITQIQSLLNNYEYLNCKIHTANQNEIKTLQIRIEKQDDSLSDQFIEFDLQLLNDGKTIQMVKINQSQGNGNRISSFCNSDLQHKIQHLEEMVERWLKRNFRYELLKKTFGYEEGSSDCINVEKIKILKKLYCNQKNLKALTIDLIQCKFIQKYFVNNPDLYGISQLTQLAQINIQFDYEQFEQAILFSRFQLKNHMRINTVNLVGQSIIGREKDRVQRAFWKLPRIVNFQYQSYENDDIIFM